MNKSEIIRNLMFAGLSMGEMYIIFGKKYVNPKSFIVLTISYVMGRQIHISIQKDNAGGTTPHNPLKIPAQKITPIH